MAAVVKVETWSISQSSATGTATLTNDVGALSKAFVRKISSIDKATGPTGYTSNSNPDDAHAGCWLSATNTVSMKRATAGRNQKAFGEVWRYTGAADGPDEFIVRGQLTITCSGLTASDTSLASSIVDPDKCIPIYNGCEADQTSVNDWDAASPAVWIDGSGNVQIERGESTGTLIVYVTVVEFTGSNWTVGHAKSSSHDAADETGITLNTDSTGTGGSTFDVSDWENAVILDASSEGDSGNERGLSDVLGNWKPGSTTTTIDFINHQDSNARNDGVAYAHVLCHSGMVVHREQNNNFAETNGTDGTTDFPSGASTSESLDELALEWFVDTTGVGTAHARGRLTARITAASGTVTHWVHRSGNNIRLNYGVVELAGIDGTGDGVSGTAAGTLGAITGTASGAVVAPQIGTDNFATGTVELPTNPTTTVTVSGLKFQPKLVVFLGVCRAKDGSLVQQDTDFSFGASDGTNDYCLHMHDADADASSTSNFAIHNDCCIATATVAGSDIDSAEVTLTSMNSDGFTLSTSQGGTLTTALFANWIAFGGTDIKAEVGEVTRPTSATTQATTLTDTTLTPALLMFATPKHANSWGLGAGGHNFNIGFAAGTGTTDQFSLGVAIANSSASSDTSRQMRTGYVIDPIFAYGAYSTASNRAHLDSVAQGSFTLDFDVLDDQNEKSLYIAIDGLDVEAVSHTQPTTNTTSTDSHSITPEAGIFASHSHTASGVTTDAAMSVGFIVDTLQNGLAQRDDDASVNMEVTNHLSSSKVIEFFDDSVTPATAGEAAASFQTDQSTLTWTNVDGTQRLVYGVVFKLAGDAFSGTAAGTLGSITGSASGTVGVEGTAAGTLASITGSAAGLVVPPEFTGTAAGSFGAITGLASGAVEVPAYTGTAAGDLGQLTGQASGNRTVPAFSGTAAGALAAIVGQASGTFALPEFSGTASGTLATITGDAAGTFALPAFSGTGAGALSTLTGNATGTFVAVFTGTGAGTLPAVTGDASGSTGVTAFTGTGAASLDAVTGSASGAVVAPAFSGTGVGTLPAVTGDASGAFVAVFTGDAAGTLAAVTGTATGTVTVPAYTGTVSAVIGRQFMPREHQASDWSPFNDDQIIENDGPGIVKFTAGRGGGLARLWIDDTWPNLIPIGTRIRAGAEAKVDTVSREFVDLIFALTPPGVTVTTNIDDIDWVSHESPTGVIAGNPYFYLSGAYVGNVVFLRNLSVRDQTVAYFDGSGAVVPPAFTGTAAGDLPAVTGDASGSVTLPAYSGIGVGDLPAVTGDASGLVVVGPIDGTAAANLAAITGDATGNTVPPAFTGTADADLSPVTGDASGSVTVPAYSGTASGDLASVTGDASGTFVPGPVSGTATGTLPAVLADADGIFVPAPVSGTAAGTLGTVTGTASGAVTEPTVHIGTAAGTLPAAIFQGEGIAVPPAFVGTGVGTLPEVTAQASQEANLLFKARDERHARFGRPGAVGDEYARGVAGDDRPRQVSRGSRNASVSGSRPTQKG